jgi:hypothetical protein
MLRNPQYDERSLFGNHTTPKLQKAIILCIFNACYTTWISQPCCTWSIRLNLNFSFNVTMILTICEVVKNLLLNFGVQVPSVLALSILSITGSYISAAYHTDSWFELTKSFISFDLILSSIDHQFQTNSRILLNEWEEIIKIFSCSAATARSVADRRCLNSAVKFWWVKIETVANVHFRLGGV